VQGAIMPDAFFANSAEPPVRRFVAAFEETYQEKPGFMEAIVYDSAMVLFDVLSRPGVRLRSEVAAALRSPAGFPGPRPDPLRFQRGFRQGSTHPGSAG